MPGLEFAGRVAALGPLVQRLQVGTMVCGILGGGGHATHALTLESHCAPIPPGLDAVETGGVPEAFVTAYDAMAVQAALRPGERVVVHGAGSGVGTAAVQIGRALGALVIGTSRTQAKLDRLRDLGLDRGVVAGPGMAEEIGPVDVVVDLVGGDYVAVDLEVCAPKGRVVVVGLLAGSRADVDLGLLLRKRLMLKGTVLRSRPMHEKAMATERFTREVLPLFQRGAFRPVVDRVVPLEDAADAYDLLARNATFGKVVLAPGG